MSASSHDTGQILGRVFSLPSRRRTRRSMARLVVALVAANVLLLLGIGVYLAHDQSATVLQNARVQPVPTRSLSKVKQDSKSPSAPDPLNLSHLREQVLPSVVRVVARDGEGSGFAVGAVYVATALHVVDGRTVSVVLHGGERVRVVRVAATDSRNDVAILEIEDSIELQPLVLASRSHERNERVASFRLKSGIRAGRIIHCGEASIRTTLEIYPGWSGSPVVDVQGEVVGMNIEIHVTDRHTAWPVFFESVAVPASAISELLLSLDAS
jgi:S1-C subfamily serine protease